MFRAQSAHHQEVNDANCTYAASSIVTLCKWPSCATAKAGLVIIKKLYYDARPTKYQDKPWLLYVPHALAWKIIGFAHMHISNHEYDDPTFIRQVGHHSLSGAKPHPGLDENSHAPAISVHLEVCDCSTILCTVHWALFVISGVLMRCISGKFSFHPQPTVCYSSDNFYYF